MKNRITCDQPCTGNTNELCGGIQYFPFTIYDSLSGKTDKLNEIFLLIIKNNF